jgi:hypothetical protein
VSNVKVIRPPTLPSGRTVDMIQAFAEAALQHDTTCPARWEWFALYLIGLRKLDVTPPDDAHVWWAELLRVLHGERQALACGGSSWGWTVRRGEALRKLCGRPL